MRRQRLLAALSVLILAVCVVPALAQWVSNGNKIFYDDGKVGVGTNNPNSPLQVVSNIGAGERPTILAKMTNSAPEAFNAAVRGMNRGTGENGIGVWGSHDGSGWGMYGTSETGIGVFGRTLTTANDAIGVRGLVVGGSNAVGVRGEASSSLSVNYGVLGTTNSGSGRGVMGENMATTGFAVGVRGLTNSQAGYGIFGSNQANSGLGIGVVGETWSTDGRGVWGDAFNNTGVNYGVYGRTTSGDGYGVYSVGELGASGTKSFRIDHPLDPTEKYLLHYSAESPDVINFYSGSVILDDQGGATIAMPVYFSEVNRDPRYFLTPVGAAMPNLHIAEELNLGSSECTFRIAGGVPGKKVCWEVKALRNDIYVRTYGAPVEIEKPETERGTYQQPELYGEPVLPLDSSSAQETATSVGADSQEPAAAIQQ